MVDFGQLWREQAQTRRMADDAGAWDKRAMDSVSKYAPSGYSEEFLRLAALQPGCTVFDMGCGAGALAIPCVERGHDVVAADFSPMMLERCRAGAPADAPGRLQTLQLAWDDDWALAGLQPGSFDVAFASRSIATPDLEASLRKLCAVARQKVCITLVAGGSPRVSGPFLADLGLRCTGHQDAAYAFGIACEMGYRPEVRFINSTRYDRFDSLEAAYEAYAPMLSFADNAPLGDELARAEADTRLWVERHLVPRREHAEDAEVRELELDRPWEIDIPRSFSWAFISWTL